MPIAFCTLCTKQRVQEYCHIPGPQHVNVTVCLLIYCAQAMGTGILPYPGSTARKCNGLSSHILCASNGYRNITISRVHQGPYCAQSSGYRNIAISRIPQHVNLTVCSRRKVQRRHLLTRTNNFLRRLFYVSCMPDKNFTEQSKLIH